MINKKNDWYNEAKIHSSIIQEAGMKETLRNAILAVSLVIGGYSLFDASQRTGLTPEQIHNALNNERILELVKGEEQQEMTSLNVPSDIPDKPQMTPHGLPTSLNLSEIENLIRLHEVSGAKRFVTVNGKKVDIRTVYEDPIHGWKVPTIGIGYNLNRSEAKSQIESFGLDYGKVRNGTQSLTDQQVEILYRNDVQNAINDAKTFLPNFEQQPSTVKTIVVDMSFNMGLTKLSTFKNFKQALINFDFDKASQEMRNSNWAKQTKDRATRLIEMMKNVKNEKNTKEIIHTN